jgi:hypothetical protein
MKSNSKKILNAQRTASMCRRQTRTCMNTSTKKTITRESLRRFDFIRLYLVHSPYFELIKLNKIKTWISIRTFIISLQISSACLTSSLSSNIYWSMWSKLDRHRDWACSPWPLTRWRRLYRRIAQFLARWPHRLRGMISLQYVPSTL